jgi:hypothetical protein
MPRASSLGRLRHSLLASHPAPRPPSPGPLLPAGPARYVPLQGAARCAAARASASSPPAATSCRPLPEPLPAPPGCRPGDRRLGGGAAADLGGAAVRGRRWSTVPRRRLPAAHAPAAAVHQPVLGVGRQGGVCVVVVVVCVWGGGEGGREGAGGCACACEWAAAVVCLQEGSLRGAAPSPVRGREGGRGPRWPQIAVLEGGEPWWEVARKVGATRPTPRSRARPGRRAASSWPAAAAPLPTHARTTTRPTARPPPTPRPAQAPFPCRTRCWGSPDHACPLLLAFLQLVLAYALPSFFLYVTERHRLGALPGHHVAARVRACRMRVGGRALRAARESSAVHACVRVREGREGEREVV